MTYDEAKQFIRDHENEFKKVRRPGWNRNLAVNHFFYYDAINDKPDRAPTMWDLDNGEGGTSGSYWLYKPSTDDIAATDWEVYDAKKLFPDEERQEDE
jgi:hypothetical protein